MSKVYIVGTGMTKLGNHISRTIKDLTQEAVSEALVDGGVEAADIQAAYFGNVGQGPLEGQIAIPGQIALRSMGISGIPVVNLENACATGSSALHMAINHVKSGAADVALAIGAEKLITKDKGRSLELFSSGWDVSSPEENMRTIAGGYFNIDEILNGGRQRSMFMDLYYIMARHHMEKYGTTAEQMAAVSSKNHFHSTMNPKAHFQMPMSIEEILAAPKVSGPLTIPMCAPLTDGAAAVIVVSEKALSRFSSATPIQILGAVLKSGSDRDPRDYENHITHLAAKEAYEQAGLGPDDMDVAEVHDAAAFGEIVQSESLGFCAFGEGGPMAERGETRLGGRIPINPSGGLESKGHPIGATGLTQIYELVAQLRGTAGKRQVEGARFGIAENGGGLIGVEEAAACITILGK